MIIIAGNREKYLNYDVAISLLKVIAMFLIFNSHADLLFPSKIQFLASGGAIGNELFFFVSGLLFKRKQNERFGMFVLKRYIRLYIPTYIMSVFLFAVGYIHLSDFLSFREMFHLLLWPSQFWFVSAIFITGIIHYFLVESSLFKHTHIFFIYSILATIVILMVYIIAIPNKSIWIVEDARLFNTTVYFKCLYSFYVFSLGCFFRRRIEGERKEIGPWRACACFVISFVLFYGFKFLINKNIIPMQYQILSQAITIGVVVTLYLLVYKAIDFNKTKYSPKIIMTIFVLGDITLESFLVQFQIIQRISWLKLVFPFNYLLAMMTVICVSILFKQVDSYISNALIKKTS